MNSRLAAAPRRIEFVILRTNSSPPVAPHLASQPTQLPSATELWHTPTRTFTVLMWRPLIPEIYPLAHLALENCSISPDVIVDEDAPAYPPGRTFKEQDFTTDGYATLLRIERGRVRHREIFGPMRLHYGVFKLQARQSSYLIAREDGRIAGAVGFTVDPRDKAVRIFELISLHDEVIRFLLANLERACDR